MLVLGRVHVVARTSAAAQSLSSKPSEADVSTRLVFTAYSPRKDGAPMEEGALAGDGPNGDNGQKWFDLYRIDQSCSTSAPQLASGGYAQQGMGRPADGVRPAESSWAGGCDARFPGRDPLNQDRVGVGGRRGIAEMEEGSLSLVQWCWTKMNVFSPAPGLERLSGPSSSALCSRDGREERGTARICSSSQWRKGARAPQYMTHPSG